MTFPARDLPDRFYDRSSSPSTRRSKRMIREPGLDYLKQELPNYWDRRQTIIALLDYLSQKPSTAMEHWRKDVDAAHLLLGAV